MANFGEAEGPVSQIHSPHHLVGTPAIFFRSYKVCSDAKEGVGMRKATEIHHSYSIPGKTSFLVPEYAVEDLPSAELQPRFLFLQ